MRPATDQPAADARDAAFRLLASHARRFPDVLIAEPDVRGLDARDASLCYAIVESAVRRWITIEWLLDRFSKQPCSALEPPMRAALLGGAAQLLFMDRVPPHAAIDTAVAWAKTHVRPGAGGMVNALLRRVNELAGGDTRNRRETFSGAADELPLETGGSLGLARSILPDDPLARLGVGVGMPAWLLRRWVEVRGFDTARSLALHTLVRAPVILHTAHATQALPPEQGRSHERAGHLVFTGTREDLVSIMQTREDIWVQDPASSASLALAKGTAPRLIVDFCAGRGTKTRQLLAMFPKSRVIAGDVDPARFADLRATFEGHPRATIVAPGEYAMRAQGQADLVVLDVPCSNTGVLPRRLEAKFRANAKQLERLASTQRQILSDAIPLLSDRGRVLYCTCSLEPDENELQAQWMARWHRLKIERQELVLPAGLPGEDVSRYHDGAFAALLGRGGQGAYTQPSP